MTTHGKSIRNATAVSIFCWVKRFLRFFHVSSLMFCLLLSFSNKIYLQELCYCSYLVQFWLSGLRNCHTSRKIQSMPSFLTTQHPKTFLNLNLISHKETKEGWTNGKPFFIVQCMTPESYPRPWGIWQYL